MSNLPVDRDQKYMKDMWGTTKLITDYGSDQFLKKIEELESKPATFEGKDYSGHYTYGYGFFTGRVNKQSELHEKIRNDDDYDDWEYGTEPVYGKRW
jgi:hypothetical protein